jgi:hypothetical protein
MAESDYLAGVQALFDGEVMGERLLLAMLAAAKSARDAAHFAAILQLETETKARMRPLMLKLGLGLAEAADLGSVPARVAGYVDLAWRDYAAATAIHLRGVLDRYQAIAALGPPEDQPVLQAVVRHEAALLSWAEAEAIGAAGDSLAAVTEMLVFKLAPPPPAGA